MNVTIHKQAGTQYNVLKHTTNTIHDSAKFQQDFLSWQSGEPAKNHQSKTCQLKRQGNNIIKNIPCVIDTIYDKIFAGQNFSPIKTSYFVLGQKFHQI